MEAINVANRKRTARSELEREESKTSISRDRRLSIRPAWVPVSVRLEEAEVIVTCGRNIVPAHSRVDKRVQ